MLAINNWEEYTYYLIIYLKENEKSKFRSDFSQLHRSDQLRFFNMLSATLRQAFYEYTEPKEFAPIFAKLTIKRKQLIVKELDESYLLTMIDNLRVDDIVDFLSELQQDAIDNYLQGMDVQKVQKIRTLLAFENGTAGALMTTEYVTAHRDDTVSIVLNRLFEIGKSAETIYYMYVVTQSNQLIGVVSLRDLMIAHHDHTMGFIMKEQMITVTPSTDDLEIISIFKDYDLLILPVVNKRNELIGIITVDDVMDIKDLDIKSVLDLTHTSKWHRLFLVTILFSSMILGLVIGYSVK